MESRVKHTHLRSVGHKSRDSVDAGHVGRVVEWSYVVAFADFSLDSIVDKHTLTEFLAAVHNAMADCVDFVIRLDAALDIVGKDAEDGFDRAFVVSHAELDDGF